MAKKYLFNKKIDFKKIILFKIKIALFLILWIPRVDYHLKPIIEKNMNAHNSRNYKTTLMFSIAISFLLFSSAGF